MKYVSCRKNFDVVDDFSAVMRVYDGQIMRMWGDPADNGMRDEVIMVHGYNSDAVNVMDAYRSNAEVMCETRVPLPNKTGFLWPGLGANQIQSVMFHKAQKMSDISAPVLKKYLDAFLSTCPPVVIAHSLGCRVSLEALLLGAKMKMLVLLGAAVNDDSLATHYATALKNVGKVLVFCSKRDTVLGHLYLIDQLHHALGYEGPAKPVDGVQTFDVTDTVPSHNDYRHDRGVWKTIKENL